VLFEHGKIIKILKADEIYPVLKEEIEKALNN